MMRGNCPGADWRTRAGEKLRGQRGASITYALLLFLACSLIGSLVLTAGSTAAGRLIDVKDSDADYYRVTSAAELLISEMDGKTVRIYWDGMQAVLEEDGESVTSPYSLAVWTAVDLFFGGEIPYSQDEYLARIRDTFGDMPDRELSLEGTDADDEKNDAVKVTVKLHEEAPHTVSMVIKPSACDTAITLVFIGKVEPVTSDESREVTWELTGTRWGEPEE